MYVTEYSLMCNNMIQVFIGVSIIYDLYYMHVYVLCILGLAVNFL